MHLLQLGVVVLEFPGMYFDLITVQPKANELCASVVIKITDMEAVGGPTLNWQGLKQRLKISPQYAIKNVGTG